MKVGAVILNITIDVNNCHLLKQSLTKYYQGVNNIDQKVVLIDFTNLA